ncbi:MAG: hypothetical protein J6Z17_02815 [Treponema sp.]|nr:hypothetical protein [Treponema sp.]
MYAFLLLALPGAIVWHCTTNRSYKFKAFIPPVLLGVFCAVILCIIREFLLTSADIVEESFFSFFLKDLLNNTALPAFIIYAAFFFISKDKPDYKVLSILPLEASFFAILLPFTVITGENRVSFFLNTCFPLIFLSCISVSTTTAFYSLKAESKLHIWLFRTAAAAVFFVPSFTKTVWMFGYSALLYIPLTLLISAGSLYLAVKAKSECI